MLQLVVRSGNVLRGTRAFWNDERHKLQAMCYALGAPRLFLTFSAADLHWESLAKIMPRYDEWLRADDQGKYRIARENLKNQPMIAAYHFVRRIKLFIQKYMQPKFEFTTYRFRFEWGRGSRKVLFATFSEPCFYHSFWLLWLWPSPRRCLPMGSYWPGRRRKVLYHPCRRPP